MSDDALSDIIDEAIEAIEHLIDIAQDPEVLRVFLAELGWTPQSLPQPFADVASAGAALLDTVTSDSGDAASVPQALNVIKNLVTTVNAIRSQPDTAFPAGIDVAAFKQTIGRDLFDYILVEHLLRNRYPLGGLLQLTGIIRLIPTPASGLRQAYTRREIPWSEIGDLITDPAKGLREAFAGHGGATDHADSRADGQPARSYGMQLYYFTASDGQLAFLNSGATTPVTQASGFDLAVVKSPGDVDVAVGCNRCCALQPLLDRTPSRCCLTQMWMFREDCAHRHSFARYQRGRRFDQRSVAYFRSRKWCRTGSRLSGRSGQPPARSRLN